MVDESGELTEHSATLTVRYRPMTEETPMPEPKKVPFEHAFADRRAAFDGLFTRLDQALEQGDVDAVNAVRRGIVDVARTSPRADLGDLSQIRTALDDPGQV